ncbi:ABC transporter substrate-binding protein [Paenibacillus mendelii]|uniref:ABC transporter substrate-binding protein n=1 Tax=Paenibacillus mendelii TaxID=206163 RepID=A0ABV6J3V9_9BACL|nr:extracellular solute-binding protein [Paenibacillus mendelii]MCQ6562016.1 extracellular solute-binding protein [Paenibacillus mendelii]
MKAKLLNRFSLLITVIFVLSLVLSACSGSNGANNSTNAGNTGGKPAEGAEGSSEEPKVLKVAFFQGGYGDSWFKELKKEFEAAHSNVTVELEGDPGIMDKMGPRFESGANLPDIAFLTNTNWQQWASQGYLTDLTDVFESSIKSQLNEAGQKYAIYQDKAYVIPWSDGVLGMAYNKGMFEENGWKVPETWAEFNELAPKIKAKGIAPIVYPGKVIGYWDFVVKPMIVQAGGFDYLDQLLTMDNPDVLNNPAKLTALQSFENLFKNDWILKGSEGLNHTESQMEFVNGKAAMIPNGNWLEAEMKASTPEGFRMAMMKVPAIEGAKEPNVQFSMVGDITVIPAKAKEQELAKEFLTFASSEAMNRKFTELTGNFRPFKYSLEGIEVSEFTQSVMDIMQNNKPFTFNTTSPMFMKMGLYPAGDAYGNIVFGSKTAEQQFNEDVKFAADKWDKYKEELGLK